MVYTRPASQAAAGILLKKQLCNYGSSYGPLSRFVLQWEMLPLTEEVKRPVMLQDDQHFRCGVALPQHDGILNAAFWVPPHKPTMSKLLKQLYFDTLVVVGPVKQGADS